MSCSIKDIHKIVTSQAHWSVNKRGDSVAEIKKLDDLFDCYLCTLHEQKFIEWKHVLIHLRLHKMQPNESNPRNICGDCGEPAAKGEIYACKRHLDPNGGDQDDD